MRPNGPLVFNIYIYVYTFPENLSVFLKTCQMIFDNSEEKKQPAFMTLSLISHNLSILSVFLTTCPLYTTCPLCWCFCVDCEA